jgi:hypothetical protein
MAAKKINEAKFTAWTKSGMKMECSGIIAGCSLELFGVIDSPELRVKIMESMKARHDKLVEAGV